MGDYTFKKLVKDVAEKTQVVEEDVREVLNAALQAITEQLRMGNAVKLRGYFRIKPVIVKGRKTKVKDLKSGQVKEVVMPPVVRFSFRLSKSSKGSG